MSSIAEDQLGDSSPRSSPPESAQTFQSLFGGGPISQNVDLEPYPESQDGEGVEGNEQDDLEIIMGNIPMMQDDQSDATYHSSDENESEPERKHSKGDSDGRVKKRKRPAVAGSTSGRMRERPDSPPSSPVYRPNRFRGFESTWRKLTAEERQNAQALETIRARDLAAHLYNAYSLRVRAGERGMKNAKGNEHLNGSGAFAFVPPRRWTAWPMSSDEVPRLDERLRREEDDAWSLRMPPDPRPSADLEETVIAMMMKTAKERFGIRDWESKRANSVPRKRVESQFEPYDGSTANEEDWDSDSELTYGADLLPVVQADDDKSKQQLRPIARNVLTQFDKLLMGLHHSQKGGVAMIVRPVNGNQIPKAWCPVHPLLKRTPETRKRGASQEAGNELVYYRVLQNRLVADPAAYASPPEKVLPMVDRSIPHGQDQLVVEVNDPQAASEKGFEIGAK